MNNTFTILPMSQRFILKPGEVTEGSIKIVNPADATENFPYKVSVTPYGVIGEDYTADLETDSTRTAIAKWIKIEEPTGEVKPNESKEIKFKIDVPENAPIGGQYATIAVSSNADATASSGVAVQNVLEMASVIYGTVNGPIEHKGEILENNIPGFVVNPPITLSGLIKNDGNIHEDATFVIKVTDFFTGNTILPTEDDDGEYSELIMPETTRLIERNISNLPALGVVKVSQTIYYMGKEPSIAEKTVIICPIWFMALVAATLLAIVFAIVGIVRKHKKAKKSDLIA